MYVKRTDVIQSLTGWETEPTDMDIEYTVNGIPSSNVVDCRHGEWISIGFMAIKCSKCKQEFYELGSANYCPNCGSHNR